MSTKTLFCLCILSMMACGPSSGNIGQNGAGDGGSTTDGSSIAIDSMSPIADAFIQADANCGSQEEEIELINLGEPPDLLIVLDRSGSMSTPVEFTDPFGATRWDAMKEALNAITTEKEDNIRFGLSFFPTDNHCGVSAGTAVAIGLNNSSAIDNAMNSTDPNGYTPAHFGLQNALTVYQSLPVNSAGQYVLFATDGLPNCGTPDGEGETDTETLAAIEALSAAGYNTYVIGFGDFLGLDLDILNDAAQAGNTPRPGGPPYYYPASNAQELADAFDTIAGGIIVPSCEYELTSLPPDPELVTVKFDGVPVPRSLSQNNGWNYHPNASTVTFFGSYCESLEQGSVSSVQFIYGCPGPVIN